MSGPENDAEEPFPEAGLPDVGPPRMSPRETALLRRAFAMGRTRYAEFGAGGSSLLAVEAGFEAIVAVETDAAWAEAIRRHPLVAGAVASGRASILHADLGKTGAWGYPPRGNGARFPAYVATMWREWARRGALPDMVLVDGRFRVASALSVAVMAATLPPGAERPLVLIHDVMPRRPQYDAILPFFRLVEKQETLLLLESNPAASPAAALATMLPALMDRT